MKEKIAEFPVSQPLTAARRKALDRLITDNAGRSPWPITHAWAESGDRLEVTTKPVEWEIVFHADKVEVLWPRTALGAAAVHEKETRPAARRHCRRVETAWLSQTTESYPDEGICLKRLSSWPTRRGGSDRCLSS